METSTETLEERRERRLSEGREEKEAAVERILGLCRSTRSTDSYNNPWGGGLHFEASGAARLSNIAGFLKGLYMAGETLGPLEQLASAEHMGPRELATHLAVSIDEKLSYLANYGGKLEIPVDGDKQVVTVPAFKVMLFDDGTFGGFGVLWHRPYTMEQVQAKARTHDEASYQGEEADGTEIPDEDHSRRWREALEKAEQDLKLCKELEEMPFYTPTWVKERRAEIEATHEAEHDDTKHVGVWSCPDCPPMSHLGMSREFIRYGFSMNGGLLLHGMGTPTFAVRIGGGNLPGWSIHT